MVSYSMHSSGYTTEEWKKLQKVQKTKRNLAKRQVELVRLMRRLGKNGETPKFKTELRRVAALCTKLGVHLNSQLERRLVESVMES